MTLAPTFFSPISQRGFQQSGSKIWGICVKTQRFGRRPQAHWDTPLRKRTREPLLTWEISILPSCEASPKRTSNENTHRFRYPFVVWDWRLETENGPKCDIFPETPQNASQTQLWGKQSDLLGVVVILTYPPTHEHGTAQIFCRETTFRLERACVHVFVHFHIGWWEGT